MSKKSGSKKEKRFERQQVSRISSATSKRLSRILTMLFMIGIIVMGAVMVFMVLAGPSFEGKVPEPKNERLSGDILANQNWLRGSDRAFKEWNLFQELVEKQGKIDSDSAKLFYFSFLVPASAHIAEEYPIESIRIAFGEAISNIGDGRPVRISASSTSDGGWASTSHTDDGKPVIRIHIAQWMALIGMLEKIDPDKAVQRFEDMLTMTILHEYYHITKQPFWQRDSISQQDLVDSECDCWAYTCDQLIRPMIEIGRGPQSWELAYGINLFYERYGRDQFDSRWRDVIKQVCSRHGDLVFDLSQGGE